MYVGIDIGGTNLKAGLVDDNGAIILEQDIPTGADRPQNVVLKDIVNLVKNLITNAGKNLNDIKAVGMGSPGMIDSESGTVIYNNNLGWENFKMMSEALNLPARLENDADAAALGEVVAGSAKGAKTAMIITLGTGVGTGFVIDGKIWPFCEFGHMVIKSGGRNCTCGRSGCFEAYTSATGLINLTRDTISKNPNSELARIAKNSGEITGRTAFDAADANDPVAIKLVDEYIYYLAVGIGNFINGLHPEVISIGGGIAKQGEKLLAPLRKKLETEIYGFKYMNGLPAKIVTCTLGYKAGIIGAAMAAKQII